MDVDGLSELANAAWLWVAGPVLAVASLWLVVILRAPQLTKLDAGIRALSPRAVGGDGEMPSAAAVALSLAAQQGAAATLAAATSVALGGPAALGWTWLFCFLVAPIRFAEATLSRTSPPGGADKGIPGSLAVRLSRVPARAVLGSAVGLLAVVVAFAFVGGVQGGALRELAGQFVPRGAQWLGVVVAVAGAALVLVGARRAGALAGYLTLAAVLVLLVVALLAAMSHPARAFGALLRAATEPFGGAPDVGAFSGALVGEIARTAVLALLPSIAAPTGIVGGIDGLARARSTKAHAAATLLGPFVYATIASLLVMAFVGTGAYYTAVEGDRTLDRVTFYEAGFATTSERLESDRLRDGFIRIRQGQMRDMAVSVAADRGMVDDVRFAYYGHEADLAASLTQGHVSRLMRNGNPIGAEIHTARHPLIDLPLAQVRHVIVHGRMLPDGPRLVAVSADAAGAHGAMGNALLAALAVLAAVAVFAFGLGASRAAGALGLSPRVAQALALLPAAGVALEASGLAPWLGPLGSLAAAALATVSAVAIVLESRSVSA